VIGHCQADLEGLKRATRDKEDEGIRTFEEIQAVKRAVDEKNSEIGATSIELEGVRAYNESLRRDIEGLHHEIGLAHEVKRR
jgi:hypothetical protein